MCLFKALVFSQTGWLVHMGACLPRIGATIEVCIYIYIYIHTYIYTYLYLSLSLSLSMYIYIYICIYTHTHTYVCMCVYIHIYIYIYHTFRKHIYQHIARQKSQKRRSSGQRLWTFQRKSAGSVTILWRVPLSRWTSIGRCHWKSAVISEASISGVRYVDTILYCAVLHCYNTILYYTILYYTILYYTIL